MNFFEYGMFYCKYTIGNRYSNEQRRYYISVFHISVELSLTVRINERLPPKGTSWTFAVFRRKLLGATIVWCTGAYLRPAERM